MEKLIYFAVTASLILAGGCKKDPLNSIPIPCFSSSLTNSNNSTYKFDASCSKGAVSYLWDFGDGITDTLPVVNHTYLFSGTYTVILTVTNSKGQLSKIQTIAVSGFNTRVYRGVKTCTDNTTNDYFTFVEGRDSAISINVGNYIRLSAILSGNHFTIPSQPSLTSAYGSATASGSGTISDSEIEVNYTVQPYNTYYRTCSFIGTKQ